MVEIDEWSDGVDIRGKWGNVMVCDGCNALHNIT